MTNEEKPKLPTTWTDVANSLVQGGVPQILAGPAGKAISRLIGAAVEVPAAWIEQKSQAIRDETKARSMLVDRLSEGSALLGLEDKALLDRGLNNMLSRAYRDQTNREAIAAKAVQQLEEKPPNSDSEGPSDEWLDVFERDAANANSERLQNLYAKILAGEVRKPGAFSLSTLRLLTILDSNIAQIFERVLPYLMDTNFVPKELVDMHVKYGELLELEAAGILLTGGGMLTMQKEHQPHGSVLLKAGTYGIASTFEAKKKLSLSAYTLTRAGAELAVLTSTHPDLQAIIDYLWDQKALSVEVGMVRTMGDQTVFTNMLPTKRSSSKRNPGNHESH